METVRANSPKARSRPSGRLSPRFDPNFERAQMGASNLSMHTDLFRSYPRQLEPQSRVSERSGNLCMSVGSARSIISNGTQRSFMGSRDYASGRDPVPKLGPFASFHRRLVPSQPKQTQQSLTSSTRSQRQSIPYYAKPVMVQASAPQQTSSFFDSIKNGASQLLCRIVGR